MHHQVGGVGFYDGGSAGFADDVGLRILLAGEVVPGKEERKGAHHVAAQLCRGHGGEVRGACVVFAAADDAYAAELAWDMSVWL